MLSTWTFLPLVYTVRESFGKHLLLLIDWFLCYHIFLKIDKKALSAREGLYLLGMRLAMVGCQGMNLYVDFYLDGHVGWMSRYYDLLAFVAALFY